MHQTPTMMSPKSMPALSLAMAVMAAFYRPVLAQQVVSFAGLSSQCVDPSGFQQCWANVTNAAQSCKLSPAFLSAARAALRSVS